MPLLQHTYSESEQVGWGQAGEAVTLLRKLETARGDRTWYFVKLKSGLQGWVQVPYVAEL